MSVTIKLSFLAGRYHATPWGRHVNEGVPEWPPSPWRLLRALVAVWRRTRDDLSNADVRRVLQSLTAPPRFSLPACRAAHTRHYMPWHKKGPADRTMVFDTFVSVSREEPLFIGWPDAEISNKDREVLSSLLRNLATFGRAETWVEAELVAQSIDLPFGPAESNDPDPVRVLCPDPTSAFDGEHYPTIDLKRAAKGKLKPADLLFDCPPWHLCLDTQTIHNQGWTAVPGARWVNYRRPIEFRAVPVRRARVPRADAPTVARFLIDGPVLPLITNPTKVAEAFRRAALSQFRRWCERNPDVAEEFRRTDASDRFVSRTLSGKDSGGEVRKDHRHAFYLPTAEGLDPRRITHVTVVADDGFGPGEVAAFNAIRELSLGPKSQGEGADRPLCIQLIGLGKERDLGMSVIGKSRAWTSATPFVVTRHAKLRGRKRDAPENVSSREAFVRYILGRELDHLRIRRANLPPVIDITWLEKMRHNLRPIDFNRYRQKRGDDGGRRPCGAFRIVFAEPVNGPIVLGHSSHFGMGLFVPETNRAVASESAP